MFLHRGLGANVDVVRSPLGAFLSAPGTPQCRRTRENSTFLRRGIGANVDVVGAVLGCFWGLLEPSWGPLGVPLGALGGFLGARWAF